MQSLDVASVRCPDIEHVVSEWASAKCFAEQAVFNHRQAEPTDLHRMVGGPNAHLADPSQQPRDLLCDNLGVPVEELALEWNHLLVPEGMDHREDCLHCVGDLEIHGMSLRPCSAQRRCLRTVSKSMAVAQRRKSLVAAVF